MNPSLKFFMHKPGFMLCILLLPFFANAQFLLVDQGIQAAGLWCFPVYGKQNTFRYLPARARLALNEKQHPEFSFMRYVLEKPSAGNITQAGGGGLLHFLVLYDTPPEQIKEAGKVLSEQLKIDEILLEGPVIFEKGRYALISSVITEEGKEGKKLMASGEAPVLENSKIALSFDLDPVRSKLLLESFKMAAPDISLVFELGFSGVTDNYEALLDIDWDKVKTSKAFGAGGSVYFVSADVELGFDELLQNQAIKLTTTGSSSSMEGLLNTVYSKLLEVMFQPIEASTVPAGERGGLEDAMAAILGNKGALGSRKTTGFGIGVSYKMKQLHSSGKARLTFNGRSTVARNHFITFNIGPLYKEYGKDEQYFRDVPLWDPAFQQMKVFVGIDGSLEREFDRMVNNVSVTLKKEHRDGSVTTRQVMVNRKIFLDSLGNLYMTYLNHKDLNLLEWMKYDYSTQWQFTGGGSLNSGWKRDSSTMINLYAPFKRQKIALEGDMSLLKNKGVRAVSVQITYPFFSETKKERLLIRPDDDLSGKGFEITLPNETEEVDYTVTWIKADGSRSEVSGKDRFGLIFIDEMPQ
jgi:hypothetical protein